MSAPRIAPRRLDPKKLEAAGDIIASIPPFAETPAPQPRPMSKSYPDRLHTLAGDLAWSEDPLKGAPPGAARLLSAMHAATATATATGGTGPRTGIATALEQRQATEEGPSDLVLRRKTGGGLTSSQRLSELSAVAAGAPSGPLFDNMLRKKQSKVYHSTTW